MMKFHYIYKITNLVTGDIYVGQHTTSNLDDGYMGSGTIIRYAIKKYGADNFKKEIQGFYEDKDELNYMERVIVNKDFLARADVYNLTLGGKYTGSGTRGKHLSAETRQKISCKHLGMKYSRETNQKKAHKGENHPLFGKHHTEETRGKMSEAAKNRNQSSYCNKVNVKTQDGRIVDCLDSQKECARKYNMCESAVSNAIKTHKLLKGYYIEKAFIDDEQLDIWQPEQK